MTSPQPARVRKSGSSTDRQNLLHSCGLLSILVLATFLIFYGLAKRPLWQDEAETACLARNVLTFGLPVASDGVNVISQERGGEFDADYVWRWSPWLQIYISAASQAMLGSTTLAARLPFALCGLACLVFTYILIARRFGDRAWALLSITFLATSVPFLIFMRQGRYYGLSGLLSVVIIYCILDDWKKTRNIILLSICLGALFHLNYLLFISMLASLLVGIFTLYREKIHWPSFLIIALSVAAICIPGLFIYGIGKQGGMIKIPLIIEYFKQYLSDILLFMIPAPVFAFFLWYWRKQITTWQKPREPDEIFVLFCLVVFLVNISILSIAPQRFFRYICHLYPLGAIVLSWAALKLWNYCKICGVYFVVLVSLTNWLHVIPLEKIWRFQCPYNNTFNQLNWPNIPLYLYISEQLCDQPDVNAVLIDFFKANAKKNDVILVDYNDLTLQFYTPFRVLGGLQGAIPEGLSPDWVFALPQMNLDREGDLIDVVKFRSTALNLEKDYKKIILANTDESFNNVGDPLYYHFVPFPGERQNIVVYQKKDME
jgi:hypothetical protein